MFTCRVTSELELRMLEPHHSEQHYALIDANREHLGRWFPWVDAHTSPETVREFIRGNLQKFANEGTIAAGMWVHGKLSGSIGLHMGPPGTKRAEIGYWIGKGQEGKGYMTQAVLAMLKHGFEELGLNRIEIRCEPSNERSKAIPKRLGFTYEGTLRELGVFGDRFYDHEVYSLLRREWDAMQAG